MDKILVLDIETTGFSRDWDFIIEIAAIVYDTKTKEVINEFHEYIKPNKSIPAKITELTNISNEMVSGCRNEAQVLADFTEWATINSTGCIVGHNCKAFDLNFIKARCLKYGMSWNTDEEEIIDTLAIARQLNKSGKISTLNCQQKTLATYFSINYEAHSAIEDVKALIKIYDKMNILTQPTTTRTILGF